MVTGIVGVVKGGYGANCSMYLLGSLGWLQSCLSEAYWLVRVREAYGLVKVRKDYGLVEVAVFWLYRDV